MHNHTIEFSASPESIQKKSLEASKNHLHNTSLDNISIDSALGRNDMRNSINKLPPLANRARNSNSVLQLMRKSGNEYNDSGHMSNTQSQSGLHQLKGSSVRKAGLSMSVLDKRPDDSISAKDLRASTQSI